MSVDPGQRFKASNPCPVCGGHLGLPQHEGRRCWGFTSENGRFAHCTRNEYAGGLPLTESSDSFAHLLDGPCQCGRTHRTTSPPTPTVPDTTHTPHAPRDPASANYMEEAPETFTLSGNGNPAPSLESYRDRKMGKPEQHWTYYDAVGLFVCHILRWDTPHGKAYRPLTLTEKGNWQQKGISAPRPLYNLPALTQCTDAHVLVVEGEKTADRAGEIFPELVVVTSMHGAKQAMHTDWSPLKGRHVTMLPDNDPDGQYYAKQVASQAHASRAASVHMVTLPEGLPPKWDLADPVPDGLDMNIRRLVAEAGPVAPDSENSDSERDLDEQARRPSPGDQLLRWAMEEADLYADGVDTYMDVWLEGVRETWQIRSSSAKRWLRGLFYDRSGKGAPQESVTHAVDNLDARASRSVQRKVYLRSADDIGHLYVDLGDLSRRVVEIDAQGWRLRSDPPVRFRRPPTTEALPVPAKVDPGEGIQELRSFLNVSDEDFVLCVAWLLAALRVPGPYPVLVLAGEPGSAKTTAARMLRSLVDPARSPTRAMPKDERDATIAARNRRVLVFDNLSHLPVWFSDLLCRFVTGQGYATRALWTDDEEKVFEASLPLILTSIDNVAVRGDLADRALIVRLDHIAETDRRTESALWSDFEEARPRIFAALLTGLSEGLRQLPHVRLERSPRMVDFAFWVTACEEAFWKSGTFMAAYNRAQASAVVDVLDDSSVWPSLREFIDERGSFEDTATQLLKLLNARLLDEKPPKGWPSTGAVLGKHLNRLAPSMRRLGYAAASTRSNSGNLWHFDAPEVESGTEDSAPASGE